MHWLTSSQTKYFCTNIISGVFQTPKSPGFPTISLIWRSLWAGTRSYAELSPLPYLHRCRFTPRRSTRTEDMCWSPVLNQQRSRTVGLMLTHSLPPALWPAGPSRAAGDAWAKRLLPVCHYEQACGKLSMTSQYWGPLEHVSFISTAPFLKCLMWLFYDRGRARL